MPKQNPPLTGADAATPDASLHTLNARRQLPPAPRLPETGFLRQPQVLVFVPISKSTLWRRVQSGSFPEPIKLSTRVTAWRAEDVRQWIAAQGP